MPLDAALETPTPQRRGPDVAGARAVVLIVDDDEVEIETFSQWIAAAGYDVRTASDGESGLQLVPGVDAIIVDGHMPGIDGTEFLRRLHDIDPAIPTALITGDYLIEDATLNECRGLGAVLMFKPIWLDNLETLVLELVQRKRSR